MHRNREQGHQVGIDLLLAGSDAFKRLADEIAAAHQRWEKLQAGEALQALPRTGFSVPRMASSPRWDWRIHAEHQSNGTAEGLGEYVMNELEQLLAELVDQADIEADGHLTLMKFTPGWKVMLGTPDLTIEGRVHVACHPAYSSLIEALRALPDSVLVSEDRGQGQHKGGIRPFSSTRPAPVARFAA